MNWKVESTDTYERNAEEVEFKNAYNQKGTLFMDNMYVLKRLMAVHVSLIRT